MITNENEVHAPSVGHLCNLPLQRILLLLFLIFATTAVADEFDHSSYKPAELKLVVADIEIDAQANYWLDASHAKYKTEVTFTGAIRPIDANNKQLITYWVTAMQHSASIPTMFNHEVQVTQAGQTYWMPIQDALVAPWQDEMREGMSAEVYLLLIGAYERVPVFTVAAFTAKE